jgi:hypothetical protein
MKELKKYCTMLMKVGPRYPGLLDFSEGDQRIITAQFKCLQTATAIGPDNKKAHPNSCQNAARSCFRRG